MERASLISLLAPDAIRAAQAPGYGSGLMRYHSAPSYVLQSLLQSEDALAHGLPHSGGNALAQVGMLSAPANAQSATDTTLADCTACSSHAPESVSSSLTQVPMAAGPCFLPQCADPHSSGTAGQLYSIFQRPQINTCDDLQPPAPTAQNHLAGAEASNLCLPASVSPLIRPCLPPKGSLLRQSSFPVEILSTLGAENGNERSIHGFGRNLRGQDNMMPLSTAAGSVPLDDGRLAGIDFDKGSNSNRTAHLQLDETRDTHASHHNGSNGQLPLRSMGWFESTNPCLDKVSNFNGKIIAHHMRDEKMVAGGENLSRESLLPVDQSALFRHNSLPARLFSQLSFDGASEKISMTSSSGHSSSSGSHHMSSQVSGVWDEAAGATAALGQRKRAREVEDRLASKLHILESIQGCSVEGEILQWKAGGQECVSSSSGYLLSADDSVLCKVRAKRGCATHPRSIAERVRRTKISDAMRKLQELVPNMEKQTNTATMLDEAVNYVKFLKQQVQKLSEDQAQCKGVCDSMNSV